MPEWSKGVDSSFTSASCVGSNPTAVIFQWAPSADRARNSIHFPFFNPQANASLAQLVEHALRRRMVVGSICRGSFCLDTDIGERKKIIAAVVGFFRSAVGGAGAQEGAGACRSARERAGVRWGPGERGSAGAWLTSIWIDFGVNLIPTLKGLGAKMLRNWHQVVPKINIHEDQNHDQISNRC